MPKLNLNAIAVKILAAQKSGDINNEQLSQFIGHLIKASKSQSCATEAYTTVLNHYEIFER